MVTTSSFPEAGDRAPAFTLTAGGGEKRRLSDFRGERVVVYFYPKDDTQGCIVEAKEFQQYLKKFEKIGVSILGISPDSTESHEKFAKKHGIQFPLLSDPDHKVTSKYGLWVEKKMYGRTFWGVQRATFLIGPNGVIEDAWPKVRPKGHAAAVFEAAKERAAT